MNWAYLFTAVLLIVFAVMFYFQMSPKKKTLIEIYNEFVLQNGKYPLGFTAGREGDNYINYYTDSSTGGLRRQIDPYPITLEGNKYEAKEHGTIKEEEDGFWISGISKKFTCPPKWYWNSETNQCEAQPICKNEDNTIKGINIYQFNTLSQEEKIRPMARGPVQELYHDRIYAICGEGTNYKLGFCPNNQIYNQKPTQPASENPCVYYDICNDLPNGRRHTSVIPGNEQELKKNEYYVCENGVSKLHTCQNDDIYSETYNGCISMGACYDKPDNYTMPNTEDENSYLQCNKQKPFKVYCDFGVYVTTDENGVSTYTCKNGLCGQPNFTKYFTNDWFSVPYAATVCTNNVLMEQSCGDEAEQYKLAPPGPIDLFTEQLDNVVVEEVMMPKFKIEYTDDTYSATRCVGVTVDDAIGTVKIRYNEALPVGEFGLNGRPILKYGNYMGKLYKLDANDSKSFSLFDSGNGVENTNARDYGPIMSSDVLVKWNAAAKPLWVANNVNMNILMTIDSSNGLIYWPKFFTDHNGGKSVRMGLKNEKNNTVVVDLHPSLVDWSYFKQVNNFMVPKWLNRPNFNAGTTRYYIGNINFYGNFVYYAEYVTYTALCINASHLSDFEGKVKILTTTLGPFPTEDTMRNLPATTDFNSSPSDFLKVITIPVKIQQEIVRK